MSNHAYDEWYTHTRWRKRRREPQLRRHPLCAWCERRGLVVAAEVAHHAEPHHGDRTKFWHGRLVSLCRQCHDSDAQRLEKGGKPKLAIGIDGWPI